MPVNLDQAFERLLHAPNFSEVERWANLVGWSSFGRGHALVETNTNEKDVPTTATGVSVGVVDGDRYMVGPAGMS